MAAGREGALVFNPAVTGTAGAKPQAPGGRDPDPDLSGGGNIGGAGTYYSRATVMAAQGWNSFSDVTVVVGTLTGTLSAEFSNASDEEILKGIDVWVADIAVCADAAVAGAGNYVLKSLVPVPYGRMRAKFVQTANTGTIRSRRVIKAS